MHMHTTRINMGKRTYNLQLQSNIYISWKRTPLCRQNCIVCIGLARYAKFATFRTCVMHTYTGTSSTAI